MNLRGQGAAIVAVHDPSGAPEFAPVMAGHWIWVLGVQVIDADAVVAMFLSRTMDVSAFAEMEAHMGAALGRSEENQIAWLKQIVGAWLHGDRLAEPLLEIGVSG